MRILLSVAVLLLMVGCGYSSRDNEMIGQVKKIGHITPLICPDYDVVDISLGTMRNGVGSMSKEDVDVYFEDRSQMKILKDAAESGALVKITYGVKRIVFCVPDRWGMSAEVVK